MLGIILTSDKTPLTVGTGNKEMYLLLISIANIDAGVCMKATSHSFAIIGYLPTPKSADVTQEVQSTLAARCFHICVDVAVESLKKAEFWGGLDGGGVCYDSTYHYVYFFSFSFLSLSQSHDSFAVI